VFKICPKLNYEFHQEYKKRLNFYKKLLKISNLTERQQQLKSNLSLKLSKLTERIQKEKEQNANIQVDHRNKFVTYGAEIWLMHYDSKHYISAKNDSAQVNKIGYDFYLSDWYSNSMTFKLDPKYKSRQDGDVI
jgi:Inositol 1,4,5-trisphosphate/ryanodine receptor